MTDKDKAWYEFIAGKLAPLEYFAIITTGKKPWQEKKWAEIRAIILKDACENCGSKDRLTISHDWHPEKFPITYARQAAALDVEYPKKLERFISRYQTEKGFKRPGLKTYRPEPTETDKYVLELDFLLIYYWEPELKSETARKALIEQHFQSLRYWSMADTRTLCRKCAFAVDKRKQNI